MNERARHLIGKLQLEPHPEGGYFREVYRSPDRVQPTDNRSYRSALTVIYFLLPADQHSSLHRVRSDEVWSFIEGDPLELLWTDESFERVEEAVLSVPSVGRQPVAVVPAGYWQAAKSRGAYSLVSCSVGPGFAFEDFELLRNNVQKQRHFEECFPGLTHLL
jgi:predicted cupin superfamily sugar epimerase